MRIGLMAMAAMLAAGPALADVKAGVDAWARGDYRRAVEEWRDAAVAGDADAQFNLGQAYKLGRGVPVDPQMAESWFRKAALQGHEQAQDNYGLALFQGGRKADAVPWLEKSAARDEPRTQLVLGTMLFNGDGVARDYPRAYALMTRAAASRPPSPGRPGTDGLQSARETLQQMDGYISPRDRERGVALAQQYADTAQTRPAATPGDLRVTESGPRAVETAAVPPSRTPADRPRPGTRPPRATPPARVAAGETVIDRSANGNVTTTRDSRGNLAVHVSNDRIQPAPRPAPPAVRPTPAPAPAAAARSGAWRVQLGAFRDRGNAEALWNRLRAKLPGASPAYVAAGGVTRLQATGFASKAAAQAACARSGTACNVVAP